MLPINTIVHGDCFEFMRGLPDNCIDLVLTDPPYGIGVDCDMSKKSGKQYGKAAAPNGIYKSSGWDDKIPEQEIFEEIFRISKNQIIWGGNYFVESLNNSPSWLVWDKNNGTTCFADCELAYTSFKSAVRMFKFTWNGMIQHDMKNKETRTHPTQKPVQLFQWCLQNYSKEGDTIFDPFSGSGTTAIACHNLNRNFICVEKDAEYHAASVKRLEQHQRQGKLF